MKKIGIIGGVGPLATADFFEKIIENTPAKKDQENIPIIIYNNPQIPDRTAAILDAAPSPVPEIIKTAKVIEDMGADFLCLPCNSSFYFYDEIQKNIKIELLNMIDITADYIKENNISNVCILGTRGTIKGEVYYKKLMERNINFTPIDDEMLDILNWIIYDLVKRNEFEVNIDKFLKKIENIDRDKNTVFALACTELPIFFEKFDLYGKIKTVNPTVILAKKAVEKALN